MKAFNPPRIIVAILFSLGVTVSISCLCMLLWNYSDLGLSITLWQAFCLTSIVRLTLAKTEITFKD